MTTVEDVARFAPFVATLGRGPGRSRALTREEAREAFGMALAGRADPHQLGAFLMLLRYRGEDADEIAGLVEAARDAAAAGSDGIQLGGRADLDWPSYGAGRTRGAPWFLLAALALARARSVRVLMHGSNAYSSGMSVADGLASLGLAPARTPDEAERQLRTERFAYLPVAALAPSLERMLDMRRLFGLRSPVNTVARLLNPASAPSGVDGVFHPAYLDVHLGVAERTGRPRLVVLKGGGGEAERNPGKEVAVHLWQAGEGRSVLTLAPTSPPMARADEDVSTPGLFAAVWHGEAAPPRPTATIKATIALALLALDRTATPGAADGMAAEIWAARGD